MISYKNGESRFNFRVAGLIFNEKRLLIHRMKKDDFYALPGGRAEMMENTEITIVREMKEEQGKTEFIKEITCQGRKELGAKYQTYEI